MKLIAVLFFGLTFLAGITLASVELAMVNCVLFLALALLAAKYLRPRFGAQGIVYGMGGAFFASLILPYIAMFWLTDVACEGGDCGDEDAVTILLEQAA